MLISAKIPIVSIEQCNVATCRTFEDHISEDDPEDVLVVTRSSKKTDDNIINPDIAQESLEITTKP